jgi:outer membrane protein TolC
MRLLGAIALCVCVCVTALPAQEAERRNLSLADCIEEALRHNLDVKIKRANPEIARYNLGAVYGNWDPNFTVGGTHNYNTVPGSVDAQGRSFSGTLTESDSITAGLQGLTPWGMTYSAGVNVSDTAGSRPSTIVTTNLAGFQTNVVFDTTLTNSTTFLTPFFATDPSRSPFQTTDGTLNLFSVRQPLLRNFWIDSTRLAILLDKKNLQISELDLRNQLISTITDVEKAYYDLISAQENIRTQKKALELADRQLTENKKRVEVGAMAPLDENPRPLKAGRICCRPRERSKPSSGFSKDCSVMIMKNGRTFGLHPRKNW